MVGLQPPFPLCPHSPVTSFPHILFHPLSSCPLPGAPFSGVAQHCLSLQEPRCPQWWPQLTAFPSHLRPPSPLMLSEWMPLETVSQTHEGLLLG